MDDISQTEQHLPTNRTEYNEQLISPFNIFYGTQTSHNEETKQASLPENISDNEFAAYTQYSSESLQTDDDLIIENMQTFINMGAI